MQFLVIGRDGTDEAAMARRMAAREGHLAMIAEGIKAGRNILGAALLDDAGGMTGSVMVVDFPDRAALDAWLKEEPYVTGGVWKDIEVIPCKIAPSFEKLLPGKKQAA